MTAADFNECLLSIGWSAHYLSKYLNVGYGVVYRWSKGETKVPADVAVWLQGRASYARMTPPPSVASRHWSPKA